MYSLKIYIFCENWNEASFYIKEQTVRVADRLSYISANTSGAFSNITTRGLLYTVHTIWWNYYYTRRFSYPLQNVEK